MLRLLDRGVGSAQGGVEIGLETAQRRGQTTTVGGHRIEQRRLLQPLDERGGTEDRRRVLGGATHVVLDEELSHLSPHPCDSHLCLGDERILCGCLLFGAGDALLRRFDSRLLAR